MRTSANIVTGLCVLGLVGCAGGTPEPTEPKPPVAATAGPVEGGPSGPVVAEAEPAGDVTPVPAPAEIVGVLRWKSPAATLASLAAYAKMPQGAIDGMVRAAIRELVQGELGSLLDAKVLADTVSTDAPLDFVIAVDTSGTQPEVIMVSSVGLSSVRGALSSMKGTAQSLGPGLWRVGDEDSWGARCAIAAAAGRVPGRLVCGERFEHVQKLGPYVARTMATQPDAPADVSFELRLRGLAQRYGKQLVNQARGLPILAEQVKLGIPVFDLAIDDAVAALVDEAGPLVDDVDSLRLDLTVDARNGAVLTGKMQFAGQKSWTVGTLLEGADKAGPAPEIFWRLPKSSEVADWGWSGDPSRFDKMMRILRGLAEGGLEKAGFASAGDRTAIAKLLRLPFGKDVAMSVATGHFGSADATAKPAVGMLGELFGSSVGWSVGGIDEAPATIRAYLEEAVKAYNRGGVQAAFKKELGSDAKMLPSVRTVPAPKELGAGALDIEFKIANIEDPFAELQQLGAPPAPGKPAAKPATTSLVFHVMLAGEGKRTWIGLGMERAALAKLLGSLKGTGSGPDALASHPGYDALRRGSHVSGGAMTLQTFINAMKPGLETAAQLGGGGPEIQQLMSALQQLPHKGETPMVMFSDVTLGSRPSTSFTMNVPRETLEDVGHIVRNATAIFSK